MTVLPFVLLTLAAVALAALVRRFVPERRRAMAGPAIRIVGIALIVLVATINQLT